MTRISALLTLWLLLCVQAFSAAEKPNILFLLSDDHSYPFLSCYGDPNVKTPALDQLAADGIKFHRFFTAAPQCVPSRAALMTGRSPVAARITRFSSPLARDETTFPELLKRDAGYFVGVCGRSYHLDGSKNDAAVGELLEKHGLRTFGQRFDYVKTGSDTEAVAQAAEFLDRKPKDQPFCLWVNFSDPHHVWQAPAEFRPDPASLKLPAHWPDLPGMREQLADYCAEVNRLDRSVKAVLDLLEKRGLARQTLVVFAGDNGSIRPPAYTPVKGRQLSGNKASMREGGSRVPMIANWPGTTPAGAISHDLTDFSDFLTTFAELAGAKLPDGVELDGRSIAARIKGGKGTPREWVYVELPGKSFVRDARWKLGNDGGFFDLKDAPFEELPVAGDTTDTAALAARKKLQAVLDTHKAAPWDGTARPPGKPAAKGPATPGNPKPTKP